MLAILSTLKSRICCSEEVVKYSSDHFGGYSLVLVRRSYGDSNFKGAGQAGSTSVIGAIVSLRVFSG